MDKWQRYQYMPATDPDEMAEQFTELVNDLGYARTFYPRSRVTTYLNELASKTYLDIYSNRKEESSRIIRFWKTELPALMYRYRRELFLSFLIFILFALIAAFSASNEENFVRGVLGDGYIEMTEENISRGDPFGVYKNGDQVSMFFQIALHNIRVAFLCFVAGFFLSLGTAYMLFNNGTMVGAFQYYFFAKGLGWQSVLVIWVHGTLEISAIIIAGAAGFVIGNSILFPGTYPRLHSLKRGARDGLKIMIGLVPVFLLAAFFEGFITRYTEMPLAVSITILTVSLSFIIWYFIIYPARLQRSR
jgi:uncharacterized membrane protein SpoIIM required for sporulation